MIRTEIAFLIEPIKYALASIIDKNSTTNGMVRIK